MAARDEKLSGRRKAAALLITLGKERSAVVLRHLSDEDIERLTWEISAMGELKADQRREGVEEFQEAAGVARRGWPTGESLVPQWHPMGRTAAVRGARAGCEVDGDGAAVEIEPW